MADTLYEEVVKQLLSDPGVESALDEAQLGRLRALLSQQEAPEEGALEQALTGEAK